MAAILKRPLFLLSAGLTAGLIRTGSANPPPDVLAPAKERPLVEFRINGEAVTQAFIADGLQEASECNREVCPTDDTEGWKIRRARLIRLIPLRQFLDREKITVTKKEIEERLDKMKKDPDPFHRYPPKPLTSVMVRECMAWGDVRLLIRADIGMQKWALRKWKQTWPTPEAWDAHCREERRAFDERFGKFRRLSFSLSRWPKGAQDEDEALSMLKQQALMAKERLDKGDTFEAVAQQLFPRAEGKMDPTAAMIVPYYFLGPRHVHTLKELAVGGITRPLDTSFAWNIMKKERATHEEAGEILRLDFLRTVHDEAEKRVAKERRLEKVNWTMEDNRRGRGRE